MKDLIFNILMEKYLSNIYNATTIFHSTSNKLAKNHISVFDINKYCRDMAAISNNTNITNLDKKVILLCKLYYRGNLEQRKLLRTNAHNQLSSVFNSFAWHMAVISLRENSLKPIFFGLLALSIEDAQTDYRDTLCFLSLLFHATANITDNPSNLFLEIADRSNENFRKILHGILHRKDEMKSITVFGFEEDISENGRTLQRCKKGEKGGSLQ